MINKKTIALFATLLFGVTAGGVVVSDATFVALVTAIVG